MARVVGVAGNARTEALRGEIKPRYFVAAAQPPSSSNSPTFLVRTATAEAALLPTIRRTILGMDGGLSIESARSMDERMAVLTAQDRVTAQLAVVFGCLALTLAVPGGAQVSLTLTGAPAVFPAPAVTDYDNGVVTDLTGIAFTVAITGGASQNRTTIVSVRSSSASLGGSKPLSDLQWRRADLAAWNAMTTADATIESRPVKKNTLNDPWSNTVFFRMLLSWTGDSPGTYSAGLVFTLTVTTP